MPADTWSPVLLTWFGLEQSQGDQIVFQHCNRQVEFIPGGDEQITLTPSLPTGT